MFHVIYKSYIREKCLPCNGFGSAPETISLLEYDIIYMLYQANMSSFMWIFSISEHAFEGSNYIERQYTYKNNIIMKSEISTPSKQRLHDDIGLVLISMSQQQIK